MLVQVLAPEEADPVYSGRVNLIDSEAEDLADFKNMKIKITRGMLSAYEQALKEMTDSIKAFCSSREADFVSVRSDCPIERMLFGELFKAGIMA